MSYAKTINEAHKVVPISMERKIEANPQEIKPVKEVLPSAEIQNVGPNLTREDLEKAIKESNRLIFKDNSHFEFKLHERTGRMMVKLVDTETDEVIKEIPPEKILDLVASIWDLVGILVDERG